ncbi:MAG: ferritin-like domain-containing protein [Chloroflexi bacterium]|nr:ferritin-like domain-containing protein [Chloroflexota bacterium]
MNVTSRPTRRVLMATSASLLASGVLAHAVPVGALQVDRDLLDLLVSQEQLQIAHYTAMLAAFDDAAFSTAGLPASTRRVIESILTADVAHLAALVRPEGESPPAPTPPVPTDLIEAMNEAVELENLGVGSYAFVIPELDRQRLIPMLIGIHSVEARHAAWLATLVGANPFPNAFDEALMLDEPASEPVAPGAASPVPGSTPVPQEIAPVITAIAEDLDVPASSLQVITVEPREWPDSSLGCPQPDMLYAQVITPGYLILVEVSGERFEYHADERGNIVRCPSP